MQYPTLHWLAFVCLFHIKVRCNEVDSSAFTDESPASGWEPPLDVPQNVTVESASSTSVIIRWEPPSKDPNLITGYKIKYRIKGNKKVETLTTDGNRRLYELTNLDKGVTYNVKIAALSANGTGPATEWLSVDTLAHDLDESQVPDKPNSIRAKANANTIYVSWTPPKNQKIMIRGYTIGWGVGFPDLYTKVVEDGKQRSFTIENLQSSSEYVISLRAFNQVGDGQPIYETVKTLIESTPEPQMPMLPPVGLKAIVLSSTTIILYWTDTTLARNQLVTDNRRYLVRYTSNIHSNSPKYRYLNTTDLNSMIDDLKPNTQYEFAVKVVKNRRESTWSMSVLNTTQEAAPSSPPRDLTVVPSNNDDPTIINLHWQPPKQPNGQITGYVIFYTTDNSQRDRDWVVEGVIGDKMTAVLKGLLPDSTYFFKIQARNNKGYGPLSAEVQFKTLPALPDSHGLRYYDSRNISTNTLYIIIAVISGISVLLLIVVGTLLCRSRNSAAGVMGAMRKPKGYVAAATSPVSKANAAKGKGRELKPPDLWIHHNEQLELKAIDKNLTNEAMSLNPIQRSSQEIDADIIEKSKKTSTYGDSLYDDLNKDMKRPSSPSDTNITLMSGTSTARKGVRAKPIMIAVEQTSSSNGTISLEPSTGLSRPLYPRTQFNISRAHVTLDSMDTNSAHLHHLYDPVASPSVHMGLSSSSVTSGQPMPPLAVNSPPTQMAIPNPNTSPAVNFTLGKRQSGHPLKSFSVPAAPPSLPLNGPNTQSPHNLVRPQPITSPNKKMALNGLNVCQKSVNAVTPTRNGELTSSYSTEELNQEMANLEGLMKDLNAITAKEFEC